MKKIRHFLLIVTFLLVCAGCGKKELFVDGTAVYYLNEEETSIVPVGYEIPEGTVEAQIEALLEKLSKTPEAVGMQQTLGENIKLLGYTFDKKQLYLDFSTEYLEMDKAKEVLVRAAIVKTMVQIEDVNFIAIRVGGEPLKDSRGINIGLMNENTFLDNMGSEENATKIVNLNLYFANKTGDKLTPQSTVIEYSANVAVEKVVVEQLITGPTEKGYYPTIPQDTKVMSVTTKDGVCYVNLDIGFTAQGYDVLGQVTIYSIVNSLAELPGITSVQILVNGETNINYKDSISLENTFQMNQEIVEKEE